MDTRPGMMPEMMEKEIHDYRWLEGERGRILSFEQAAEEWYARHGAAYVGARRWHMMQMQMAEISRFIGQCTEKLDVAQRRAKAMQWCTLHAKEFRDAYERTWGPVPN